MEYKPGQSFHAKTPFATEPRKIHIEHVLDSIYEGQKLIVYRVFGKHKRWWHEIMCTDRDMDFYIELAKKYLTPNKP